MQIVDVKTWAAANGAEVRPILMSYAPYALFRRLEGRTSRAALADDRE